MKAHVRTWLAPLALAAALPPASLAQTLEIDLDTLHLPAAVEDRLRQDIAEADWRHVEALLFSLANSGAPRPELLEALAAAHLQCGRNLQAARAYLRAARARPLGAASRFALAKAYLGLEKRHWARRELERLAAEEPENPRFPAALASIFHDFQWYAMAEEQARIVIKLDPDSSDGYVRLGQALEGRNEADAAIEAYRAAVEKDRKSRRRSALPAFHLGSLLLETGSPQDALEAFEEALDVDPNHVSTIYEHAMALGDLGRSDEATASLEKAARLAPADARIHYALAGAYRRTGMLEKAQEALRRFKALSER